MRSASYPCSPILPSLAQAYNSGATACTVFLRGNKLYVAWLGDSQACGVHCAWSFPYEVQVMMCKGGVTVPLMDPHKPNREDEKKRIEGISASHHLFMH